jgi:conjugal transfer pilus assembly protein TraW
MIRKKYAVLGIAMWSASMLVCAEDLGVKGQTYKPDRDGREQFKDVIRKKQSTGELDRFWQDYRDKNINAIKNPAPLGIKSDYKPRNELRDVKFVVPSDYRDEKGRLLVRKGTVVEPLSILPLANGLIFIDGRDQHQVEYAITRSQSEPLKIVLTAGSPYALRVKYKDVLWRGVKGVPFYFDQRKIIINTLNQLYGIDIGSVPAVLAQRGNKLGIEFGMRGSQ